MFLFITGEIIVYDNNSSDGTMDYIKSKNHEILFIDGNENLGFSKANNIAAKSANAGNNNTAATQFN